MEVITTEDKIVMTPRSYQLELVDYITKRNAIVFLPTGSGKTFIAMLALKRFSHELQEPISRGGKRAIFMCNTVELARQQATEIKKTLNLKVGLYTGERNVDGWTRSTWENEIEENQIFVGTAQIFVDIVRQNYIKLSDLSITIFDECHHAKGSHPMHQFLSFMQGEQPHRLPRIVGLTGVLLKGNKMSRESIERELKSLEATLRGNIITVSNMEQYHNVMVYSTKPYEKMITYEDLEYEFKEEAKVKRIVEEACSSVDTWNLGQLPKKLTRGLGKQREPSKKNFVKNLLKDFLYQMEDFGLYAGSVAIMSVIIELEIRKRQLETLALRNMYRILITKCERIRHILVKKMSEMSDGSGSDADRLDIILNFSSPKMISLLTFIKSEFKKTKPNDINCLIFVERRYSAKCVYFVLKEFIDVTPEIANILRPNFMIGRNTIAPGIKNILERKWNNDAITQFRKKECNLIVCSSVLEEGIDVQACNYVFVLDRLKTFNSYIQTKGRARQNDSLYAIFASKSTVNEITTQIAGYQQMHDVIKSFLVGRTLDRDEPLAEDIAVEFTELIKTYVIPSGARLNAESALQVLARYCQKLPSDAFGACCPWFDKHEVGDKYIVSLKLPLQSTLQETIVSDPMNNARWAKISAAFKACIKLHELGELNDKLLPITRRECLNTVKSELFKIWKKYPQDTSKSVGSKTNRRVYDSLCPEELYGAMPVVGEPCFAYEIIVRPDFEKDENNEHLISLMWTPSNYALLLSKQLPPLAEMPLFMTQGKIKATIISEPKVFVINDSKQLDLLRKFHIMIFRDLLDCWKEKNFFVLDHRNKENSYLLAPMINGQLNWDLVLQFQRLTPLRSCTEVERQAQVFKPEDFLGRIVNTWYSLNDAERYVVIKILTDANPSSPFPNGDFKSYAQFMDQKYNLKVMQPHQFLLEVKALTSRRNFYINAKNKMSKNVSKRAQASIVLIPEMCHNFMYPADMWLKAIFLPSILHRLYYMLHAENLRNRINDFLDLTPKLRGTYQPKPLIIDSSLRRVVDADGNAIEECEKKQKMLPSLPVRFMENVEVKSLMNSETGYWKDYMEPHNMERDVRSIFPIEIDYYHKFISGMVESVQALSLDDSEEYCNRQLNVARPKYGQPVQPQADNLLQLTDVSIETKRYIKILDISFNQSIACSAEQCEFLAALTTAAANDVFDMERFEVLGDSFLKFSISLFLMHKHPKWHEGFLTEVKSQLVSNRNLLYCMREFDIPNRISGNAFKPNSEWLPPLVSVPSNILDAVNATWADGNHIAAADLYELDLSEEEKMSGKCSEEQFALFYNSWNQHRAPENLMSYENDVLNFIYKQSFSDKVVADTMEAILGVCVKNYGFQQSFRMLNFFGFCQDDDNELLAKLLDLKLGSPLLRTNVTQQEVDGFLINYKVLEENLGYQFQDRAYLLQAMTHPSFPTNRITGCYQQLEFIGDAILDFLISCYIFERCAVMNPGQLTDLRSALVNNITLGCVCVRHRFHLFLLAENSMLAEAIKRFADFQVTQDHRVTDQVRILTDENDNYGALNLAQNIDVPKTLGDIVEALIAAVYLDCRDLTKTWHVIYGLLEPEINEFMFEVPIDPVRKLYEYKGADPKFSDPVVDNELVMVQCSITCLDERHEVHGFGSNKANAKKSAAKHALQILSQK